MVKRFYYGLISLRYVYFMIGLPMIIFILAFMLTKKRTDGLLYAMGILAVILAVVMFFYYKNKLHMRKVLKNIDNLEEYSTGGMVDCSYILEDRMLTCMGIDVRESRTDDIHSLSMEEGKHGRIILHYEDSKGSHDMSALSKEEAQRFAAFLKRKNPDMVLHNIVPSGSGTLKELGAGVQV